MTSFGSVPPRGADRSNTRRQKELREERHNSAGCFIGTWEPQRSPDPLVVLPLAESPDTMLGMHQPDLDALLMGRAGHLGPGRDAIADERGNASSVRGGVVEFLSEGFEVLADGLEPSLALQP